MARTTSYTSHTLLIALTAMASWYSYLQHGLFVDEAGSYWVINDSVSQVVSRSLSIQGQSPFYYILLWGITQLTGYSELSLRMLSLFSGIGSLFIFYRILTSLYSHTLAVTSLLLLCGMKSFVFATALARPYGLGLLCGLASCWLFLRWIDEKRFILLLCTSLFFSLSIYSHYIFITFFALHLGLLWQKGVFRKALLPFIFASLLSFLLAAPGTVQLFELHSRLNVLAFKAPSISFQHLLASYFSVSLTTVFSLILVVFLTTGKRSLKITLRSEQLNWRFPSIAFLIPPFGAFLASSLLNTNLMIERYYILQPIGTSILCALLISCLQNVLYQRLITFLMVGLQTASLFSYQNGDLTWSRSIEHIKMLQQEKNCIPLVLMGFNEAREVSTLRQDQYKDFLESPLNYYDVSNITLLPASVKTSEEMNYIHSEVLSRALPSSCIQLIIWEQMASEPPQKSPHSSVFYLQSYLEEHGYSLQERVHYGSVYVAQLLKPPKS